MNKNRRPLSQKELMIRAVKDSFVKLAPKTQLRNPVMFLVYVSAVLTTALYVCSLFGVADARPGFILAVAVILWFTVLFADFAEAIAEGRGKAQADALRAARQDVTANKIPSPDRRDEITRVKSACLRKGDLVLGRRGRTDPRRRRGDRRRGVGRRKRDHPANPRRSSRESGGDRSAVTGGTTVTSDQLVIRVTSEAGESFLDKMIAMVEGASRKKTPNEIALQILLVALTIIFLLVTVSLYPFSAFSAGQAGMANPTSVTALVALLVCLAPTTIGALLSAIGIAA